MRLNPDWAVKILALILVLTASVAADDWRVSYDRLRERIAKNIDWGRASARRSPHIAGTFRVDDGPVKIFYDTARYYAKVDTVLSCPECYQLLGGISTWRDTTECLITGDRCYRSEHVDRWWKHGNAWIRPDTTFNTTWLPKIQVWLDSTRYKTLMEMLKE